MVPSLEKLQDLFEPDAPVPKDLLKRHVYEDFKATSLIGVPDANLQVTFSEEDDILVRRIDQENALGYSVFAGEQDYFDRLSQDLYEPTEEDIRGGTG